MDYKNISHIYTLSNFNSQEDKDVEILFNNNVLIENNNILDLGCGFGEHLIKISKNYKCNCYGIDPYNAISKMDLKENPKIIFRKGDHENIIFDDNYFDLIYMIGVPFYDYDSIFKNLVKKTKCFGKICIESCSWNDIEKDYLLKYLPSIEYYRKKLIPNINILSEIALKYDLKLYSVDILKYSGYNFINDVSIKSLEYYKENIKNLDEMEYLKGIDMIRNNFGKRINLQYEWNYIWFNKETQSA